ncbi:MAG: NAD-dependent epimerase/dehydratase family protein [Sphaerochaetaceae bacterium]
MITYLVTGSDGHLGNTVMSDLVSQGRKVRGLRLPNSPLLSPVLGEVCYGDVTDKDSLDAFFSVDEAIVIHTAGLISVSSRMDKKLYAVNVLGTRNIIDKCKEYKVRKLLYVSSVHAFPVLDTMITETKDFDPDKVDGPYAKTKAMASKEVLAASDDLYVNLVHPSGILGPGDYGHGHLTGVIREYLSHKLTTCVHGGYDIVDVRDVAKGILAVLDKGRAGENYILSGTYHEISDLLALASEYSGHPPIKTFIPLWLAKTMAPLAELYYKLRNKPALYSLYALATLSSKSYFSCAKAENEVGYTHRSLEETVRDTLTFMKSQNP